MKLQELVGADLTQLPDEELLSLHLRLHQLYGRTNELDEKDLETIHGKVVEEMTRRGFNHNIVDELDKKTTELCKDVVLIPDFVSIVGSIVHKDDAEDVDIVIRAERLEDYYLIRHENIDLPLRKLLDPEKSGKLHYIPNPQGPHSDYIPLFDLILRPHMPHEIKIVRAKPGSPYELQTPKMSMYTEFLSVDELWEKWCENQVKEYGYVLASPKIDGFRIIIQKNGEDVDAYLEGFKENIIELLPSIEEVALKINHDYIIEGELHFKIGDKFVARPQIITCLKKQIGEPYVFLFDLVYFDSDVADKPFEERYEILKEHFDKSPLVILPQIKVKTKKELEDAAKDLLKYEAKVGRPHVEGVVTRVPTMPYVFGSTNLYAKFKLWVELKVAVLKRIKTKNGYVYECGLKDDKTGEIVSIGRTFNTNIEAEEGQTLNVTVEELILYKDGHVAWGKPTVQGVEQSRGAYTVAQAIDIARRGKCLKEEVEKAEPEEDLPAGERVWKEMWYKMYPKSGKGKFVYQLHFRGLGEDEIKLGIEELLKRGRSVHADLRFEAQEDNLWGFTVFLGDPKDVLNGKTLENAREKGLKFQGTFKLAQPKAWLRIGDPPYVSEPGEVGSTSKKYAKFFKVDEGEYEVGVWREHMLEIFMHGKKLDGRVVIEYAPVGGRRIWLLEFPSDQTPYAEKRTLDEVVEELKKKGQKYLVWNVPGEKPKLIEVNKISKDTFTQTISLIKMKPHYVLAPVLVPDEPDYYGDIITAEEIRRAATEWITESRAIGLLHEELLTEKEARVVDSFVAPCDIILEESDGAKHEIKKGTWLLGIEILDPLLWEAIEKGHITGLSIEGTGIRTPASEKI